MPLTPDLTYVTPDLSNMFAIVGNPCAGFKNYRSFVITVLPQLKILDGTNIEISERLIARQSFEEIKNSILQQERNYLSQREKEKQEV